MEYNNYSWAFALGLRHSLGNIKDNKIIDSALKTKPLNHSEELFFKEGCKGNISFTQAANEIITKLSEEERNEIKNKFKIK